MSPDCVAGTSASPLSLCVSRDKSPSPVAEPGPPVLWLVVLPSCDDPVIHQDDLVTHKIDLVTRGNDVATHWKKRMTSCLALITQWLSGLLRHIFYIRCKVVQWLDKGSSSSPAKFDFNSKLLSERWERFVLTFWYYWWR